MNETLVEMSQSPYQIFVSHGSADIWVVEQIAKTIESHGGKAFLDERDVPKGGNFKRIIQQKIEESNELFVLFTPWSVQRSWVWIEVGAAWVLGRHMVAVLYGLSPEEFIKESGGRGIFDDTSIVNLNEVARYFEELSGRISYANCIEKESNS